MLRDRAQQLISFGSVTEKNVEQLRKLNLAVFPVRYNDKFYQDIATINATVYTHLGESQPRHMHCLHFCTGCDTQVISATSWSVRSAVEWSRKRVRHSRCTS